MHQYLSVVDASVALCQNGDYSEGALELAAKPHRVDSQRGCEYQFVVEGRALMERELGLQAARLRARSEPASRWNAAGEFAPRKSGGPRTADVNPPENR